MSAENNSEVFHQYMPTLILEPKLYRPQDLCFMEEANLVASQKPIFPWKGKLLKSNIRHELGFIPVEVNLVLEHFEAIIKNWENEQ
ncbi:MAG: hypothetical protein QNJ68_23175 [Microcoleaceae cyanobacterium MO_207.B10]|nr:hypothetical protein [Microcoleaceae cyanobacterium MO_207.B10]